MEQAFLLVEEIKEAKDQTLQKTLLARAVQHLTSLPPLEIPNSNDNNNEISTPVPLGSVTPSSSSFRLNNALSLISGNDTNEPKLASSQLPPLASAADRFVLN